MTVSFSLKKKVKVGIKPVRDQLHGPKPVKQGDGCATAQTVDFTES